MAKPYDVTTKALVEAHPLDWVRVFGYAGTEATIIDADLATVTTEADRVIRVERPVTYLFHQEFQAGRDALIPERLLRYNVLLRYRHLIPVHSAVVLLRPEADDPRFSGELVFPAVGPSGSESPSLTFRYDVFRLWRMPVEPFLHSGLGTLPLAPLANVGRNDLSAVVHEMNQQIQREATEAEAQLLWATTYILLGLRWPTELADELLQGVRGMRESATYQKILAEGVGEGRVEGRLEGERRMLLRLGTNRFGEPSEVVRTTIEGITQLERLETLGLRLFSVESWAELLA
jgi:predicted transposase YdaD